MERGVVIMQNITFREHNYLRYSSFKLNDENKQRTLKFRDILQLKLEAFDRSVKKAYEKMLVYAFDKSIQTQLPIRMEDILHEYSETIENGLPILNKLINQLNHKQITEESFHYMMSIIEHQWKMTSRIIERDLSLDRLETVYNHLLNVSYYLESDLEIDSLPSSNLMKIATNEEQKLEISPYDLSLSSEFYKTGA